MLNKFRKIFDFYQKPTVFIIAHILVSVLCIYSAYRVLFNYEMYNSYGKFSLLSFIVSTLILIMNIIIALRKKMPLEKIFVLVIIPIGLAFTFLQLPKLKPDEPYHFYRAYDIVNGNIYPKKNSETNISEIEVPVGYINQVFTLTYQNVHENAFEEIDYEETDIVYSTAAGYSLVTYLPSALALAICKAFSFSGVISMYMARLFNLIITIVIGYFIIKKVPMGKAVFFILMLNPMFLHQATAINTDAIVNVLSFAFIAYILHLKFNAKQVKIKTLLLLFAMLIIITLGKLVYFPLVLLLLIIPKEKIVNKKNIICIVTLIIINIILIILSQMVHYELPDIYMSSTMGTKEVVIEIVKNPLKYFRILWNTIEQMGFEYITTFAGRYQDWYETESKSPAVIIYLILLALCVIYDRNKSDEKYVISKKDKWILFISVFIIINLIFFAFYMSYDLSREEFIIGIQGRYFIPVVPMILMGYYPKKKSEILNKYLYYCVPLLLYCNISIILNIVK